MDHEDEYETCEVHDYTETADLPYNKLKSKTTILDWILGTELDKTRSYRVLYCKYCGDTLEIEISDISRKSSKPKVHELPITGD